MSSVVNGRYIKNFPLVKAIHEGYHTLLPIGRHPITFIEINMDPIFVDVNVHPSKLEVRLSKETELHELIRDAIKDVFKQQQLIPSAQVPKKTAPLIKNQSSKSLISTRYENRHLFLILMLKESISRAFVFTDEIKLGRQRPAAFRSRRARRKRNAGHRS